ncbi:glycosyltransferase family 4 protein [Acinetobacter lwoffii]|jgi:glycosyltransferase involved in cell wall biosynthesis|uniref:glycosyltransferase family 4 protein n=1 Tax=Acinetobacter lwoffii TaxID=28090 RepID=UPI00209A9DB8|nr:glycosyltransferase family 4 protein [Acinetobacter lwoffii]MCO8097215.1 glycosyltransferase family 4 protein [Acinetobacter lwoffii]
MINKKIAIIGSTAYNLYNFRKDFIFACLEQGHQVYAFVSEYDDQWLDIIKNLGATPISYQLSRGGLNPLSDLYSIFQLINKIKEIQPDIVFSYSTKPIIYATLAAYKTNVPYIYGMIEGLGSPFTIHKHGQSLKTKFIRFVQISLYRLAFPYLDKIIFLNRDDPKDLVHRYNLPHKNNAIEVLGPIGLNLQEYAYTKWDTEKNLSFIFIARLIAEKGIFEYLEAARIVKEKYPDITFKIIGGLDPENPTGLKQAQLDQLIETGIIEYAGFVKDVNQRIRESAVFVLPSYYREGVPRSTQEAMAIGRPVITTDVPGCNETVVDGVTGFLISKWDVNALVKKMIYFIEYPEQVNKMGYQGFLYAKKNFNADHINHRLLQILGMN